MKEYLSFCKKYPLKSAKINGEEFKYRHHINENSSETLVLLVGGLGLSDLFYTHFEKFSKNYSVITFDYSTNYATNEKLASAISELLKSLNVKAWLVGQSLGGFLAQLIAQKHTEVTKGLLLSNTGCLSEDMSKTAYKSLLMMMDSAKKSKQMLNLLMNMDKHKGMKKCEFTYLTGKVLLILSDDDDTFNSDVKNALIDLMPTPKVITNIKGGHLSLMVNCDKYVKEVDDFIKLSI